MSELQFDKFMEVMISCVSGFCAASGFFFFLAGMLFYGLCENALAFVSRSIAYVFKGIRERDSKDVS